MLVGISVKSSENQLDWLAHTGMTSELEEASLLAPLPNETKPRCLLGWRRKLRLSSGYFIEAL